MNNLGKSKTNGTDVHLPQIGAIPPIKKSDVVIAPPHFEQAVIEIRGTAPYVQHRFSQKSLIKIQATQAKGERSKKGEKREPRRPEDDYQASFYISDDGWYGMPCSAFRNGAISACKISGYQMTRAKLSIFVLADGFDKIDGTPLVRIYGKPHMNTMPARNDDGSADIRYRPMWDAGWTAKPRFRWDADQFSATDIVNLVARLVSQVGIGEGRPDSKNSAGIGWGTAEIVS